MSEGEAIELPARDDAEDIGDEAEQLGHGAEDHVRGSAEHGERPDDGPGQGPRDRPRDVDPSRGSILEVLDVGIPTVFDPGCGLPAHAPHLAAPPGSGASTSSARAAEP